MSPFGAWLMVSEQLHYITSREEIFDFSNKNAVFIRLVAFPKHLFICNKDKEKDCEYHKLITTSHKWRLRHLLYRLSRIYAKCNVSFRGHYYIKCPYILTFLFLLILPLFSFILSSFQSYIYLYIIVIYFSS